MPSARALSVYMPAIYVLNKIDQISIEELELVYQIPHCVPISAHHKWNFDDLLELTWEYLGLVRMYAGRQRGRYACACGAADAIPAQLYKAARPTAGLRRAGCAAPEPLHRRGLLQRPAQEHHSGVQSVRSPAGPRPWPPHCT